MAHINRYTRRTGAVNEADRDLAAALFQREQRRRYRKPARCVKCNAETWRRLNDEVGLCTDCKPDE